MGETRVDLLHLLEDLRDAYPGAIEETILTEIVANSLDSGASQISFTARPAEGTLIAVDNGSGMKRRELIRYHDLAASTKARGAGIGFAGVGIKLGLLVCQEVVTETQRGRVHIATRWHLAGAHKAPWKWIEPPGALAERGTAVQLKLENPLSPLLDDGFIESTLRRCYQPLLDPAFEEILSPHYPNGVALRVGGRTLEKEGWSAPEVAPLSIRMARKRKPSALGYLVREPGPLPEERQGLAVSTFGKVIKHGWDWLGISPATPDRVGGLIEAPALAESLTLNKGDFVRVGSRGALYLAYRKAIQEAVSRRFELWGEARSPADQLHRRVTRPVARDLEQVLADLSGQFPLLASLVEKRLGGQKRLPIGGDGPAAEGRSFLSASLVGPAQGADAEELAPPATPPPEEQAETDGKPLAERDPMPGQASLPAGGQRPRPIRFGLRVEFESRPDDQEPGRLVESTVLVNEAHPAYLRARTSRSEGYHIALAVALALARLAVEPSREHDFVVTFLSRWGEALKRTPTRSRR